MTCLDCGLPDWYDGDGDGIGSCECPRCDWCGAAPGVCSCGHADDFADFGDDPADEVGDWGRGFGGRLMPVETLTPAGGVL